MQFSFTNNYVSYPATRSLALVPPSPSGSCIAGLRLSLSLLDLVYNCAGPDCVSRGVYFLPYVAISNISSLCDMMPSQGLGCDKHPASVVTLLLSPTIII